MSGADELVEGEDYYRENGNWVFTAKYLLRRGYCCRSGCRHCPYGFVRDEGESPQEAIGKLAIGNQQNLFTAKGAKERRRRRRLKNQGTERF